MPCRLHHGAGLTRRALKYRPPFLFICVVISRTPIWDAIKCNQNS